MTARLFGVLALILMTLTGSVAAARKGEDRREVEARALFAKGDYQGALDIFATLFAEKSDPVYLRNIGRSYQKLEQPAKSIDAFREYLRRGKVKGPERAEVEGFIQEMEELQKRQAATTPPPASEQHPEPPHEPAPPPPIAAATPPVEVAPASAPGATLTQSAAPPETSTAAEGSITHRWWFWTGLAVLVAGGATAALLMTRSQGGVVPPCPRGPDVVCPL